MNDGPAINTRRTRRRRRRTILSAAAIGLALIGIVAAVVPRVNIDREDATRVRCAGQLRRIGQAITLYAAANSGAPPGSVVAMLRTAAVAPEEFVCPRDRSARPAASAATFAGSSADCSYAYVGDRIDDLNAAPPDAILAFDRDAGLHDGDGLNVLFADGHVEFLVPGKSSRERTTYVDDVLAQIARGERPVRWPQHPR